MVSRVRGNKYRETLGRVVDYERLAVFLIDNIINDKYVKNVVDVPCGNGQLLSFLEEKLFDKSLFGIDNSADQISLAKYALNRTMLINFNIFNISKIPSILNISNGFCHIGFSFFNTLDSKARNSLLRELYHWTAINTVGFEIQNPIWVNNFNDDKWYTSVLSDGTRLFTKSISISKNKRKLYLKFNNDNTCTIIEHLYKWPIKDAIDECLKAGWINVKALDASYRKSDKAHSHYFIIAKK